ncbi:murein biosynthesis integral membrane protein MurJ [Thalassoroseus pseudoceratinae]|uniref:murein biosynthesis integral membrane protein MurJ n=1 Tax=Thalassoroseus pseudoceratinae TaxID=2713176 RepID=UPI00141E9D20|nr:murein biosynthesis integral membrane protein MurJ [Thalassoroseus pseudoceratinae]
MDAESSGNSVAGNVRLISGCTFLSRILGLVRDAGMAMTFGNGLLMDAFTIAFRLPNLARRLFGEGALTAAFLPAFVAEEEQSGPASAARLARGVLFTLSLVLLAVILLAEVGIVAFAVLSDPTPGNELLLQLTAILLPYLGFICLSAQFSAILHGRNDFLAPALVPIVLNIVWIAGLIGVTTGITDPKTRMIILAACVVFAGFLQFALPASVLWQRGFPLLGDWRESKSQVIHVWQGVLPILCGLAVTQLNPLIDSLIAWSFSAEGDATSANSLASGTASALYLGQRLFQFPIGVFGVALGTVLFPRLARSASQNDFIAIRRELAFGLRLVTYVTIPATAGLMLLAGPLTDLLFRHGAFDSQDAQQTSAMILAYGAGVWSVCGLLIVNRTFYALGNRETPLRLGLFALVANVVLDFLLLPIFKGSGLAWATSISLTIQLVASLVCLRHTLGEFLDRDVWRTIAKSVLATTVMTLAVVSLLRTLPATETLLHRFLRVGVPVAAAVAIYAVVSWRLRMPEFHELLGRSDSKT